jgi:NADH-quinone oxidoreductase subunit D
MVTRDIPPGFTRIASSEDTEEFFLNIGPQHPSTHGVLRLVVRLDGETVHEIVPHMGYIHRGIEKMGESQSYLQYIHLTDRMDYICSHMNNLGVCLAIEQALGIGVPERGEFIRVIVNELQRIQSHLLFWAAFGGDLGALSTFLYGFKDREVITDIFDELCGSRLTMNFFRPGGSAMDFPDTTIPRIRAFIEQMKHSLGEYDRLITHNVIIQARSKDIGVLSPEKALAYGCTGPVLRGSGVRFDLRKNRPYSIYDRFEFDIPIGRTGDCYDRYLVRMEEIRQSLRILEQAIAAFPAGPHRAKELANIKLPAGTYYSEVETAKGIFGTAIVADGTLKPYRIHNRSPNFCNVTVLDELCRGHKIADIVAVLATIDVVIPDIDR